MDEEKIVVGWRELCELPDLGLHAVNVKIDTGAATSSLHAIDVTTHEREDGQRYARFLVHPVQRSKKIERICEAPLVDKRHVTSSSGHKERRHVILTPITLDGQTWNIEVTLTDRGSMGMRMLLGREAMRGRIQGEPGRQYLLGYMTNKEIKKKYR